MRRNASRVSVSMSEILMNARRRRRTNAWRVAAPFAFVVVVMVTLFVATTRLLLPSLRITRVHVDSDAGFSRDQLLRLIGLDRSQAFFRFDPRIATARLHELAVVETALVRKQFPRAVHIAIRRRRPVAVTIGRSGPLAIDTKGYVFHAGTNAARLDLPVLTLRGGPLQSGVRVEPSARQALVDLNRLRLESPEVHTLISEVAITTEAGRLDLTVFFRGFSVPVRFIDRITIDDCTYALMILDVLTSEDRATAVDQIDMRSGQIVYRERGGADGNG